MLRPESRGSVRLASNHAAVAPAIDPNFLADERDMALMRDAVRLCKRICDSAPLADYQGRDRHPVNYDNDAELDAVIRARADTIYHPVGTCRMGADADSVVDQRLRMRALGRLRIADASVMPTLVSGNTNAPAMMIGARAAAFMTAR